MSFVIPSIVEGHGDVQAVPVLLRMIDPTLQIARPVRFPRNQLMKEDQLVRAAMIAAANIADQGGILLVMDADEDCAARLGPKLERQLSGPFPNRICRVALAVREFEAWIIGGDPAYGIDDADRAGQLKERISQRMGIYKETVDQPKLIAAANLSSLQQRSRSFRRLTKIVREFTAAANS